MYRPPSPQEKSEKGPYSDFYGGEGGSVHRLLSQNQEHHKPSLYPKLSFFMLLMAKKCFRWPRNKVSLQYPWRYELIHVPATNFLIVLQRLILLCIVPNAIRWNCLRWWNAFLSNRFIVYVGTGENDAKTLRVDANVFENGGKKLHFQTNTDTRGQGLN